MFITIKTFRNQPATDGYFYEENCKLKPGQYVEVKEMPETDLVEQITKSNAEKKGLVLIKPDREWVGVKDGKDVHRSVSVEVESEVND